MLRLYSIAEQLLQVYGLTVQVAAELEFYFTGNVCFIREDLEKQFFCELVGESGCNQYEMRFSCFERPLALSKAMALAKKVIMDHARNYGNWASFAAKPFANQPGSGMHVHINYFDRNGVNLFSSANSEAMLHAIGGLCCHIRKHMLYFAPCRESYLRFAAGARDVPSNISWGPDNRTTALRLPPIKGRPDSRRIEHRIAGADSDPFVVVLAVVLASLYGMHHKILPNPATYGLAFDEQYDLESLPLTLEEAIDQHEPLDLLIKSLVT